MGDFYDQGEKMLSRIWDDGYVCPGLQRNGGNSPVRAAYDHGKKEVIYFRI
ncbi:MAG: hypothetical protein HY308_06810 [Gammaproteobacteria bacterium]|nr:hypothetical protein [Gammaproteobacteria bacterium]